MTAYLHGLRQKTYAVAAVAMAFAIGAVGLMPRFASAAQLGARSIELSDSSPSGNAAIPSGVGSGTNVTYKVMFTTSASMQSAVIDFCGNTPLIEDTSCGVPTGMVTTGAAAAGYTVTTPNAHQVKLSLASAAAAGAQTITLTGITNPTATGSLYARITTYADAAFGGGDPYVSDTNVGTYVDYGGVAMAIAQPIMITARVMESLSFCTSAAAVSLTPSFCTGETDPNITLGHGTNKILDSTAVDTAPVYSLLSTNAQSGATIRMHTNTSCGGLSRDGGTTCDIAPVGTLAAITNGQAKFGVRTSDGTAVSGGTGTATLDPTYASTTDYAMDTAGVTGAYGDDMASTAGAVNGVNVTYTFGASASNTTPAGIYTTNESLIATGTF